MKKRDWLILLAVLAGIAAFVRAEAKQLESVVIPASGSTLSVSIGEQQIVHVYNFSQDSDTTRGVITVTENGSTHNVMTATLVSSTSAGLTRNKTLIIAGPATMTVAPVTGTNLFISYLKGPEPSRTPTPTPTPTPTATPEPTPTPTPTA